MELRQAVTHPDFTHLPPLRHWPDASRVLLRRAGYRELWACWQRYHQAYLPVFDTMQHAIDVRDAARLYELWVWLELIDLIREITSMDPVMRGARPGDADPPTEADFGSFGRLVYNQHARAYSNIRLRPDFSWFDDHGLSVVFDAKFRMSRPNPNFDFIADDTVRARDDDLGVMHQYRDALKLRAAVCIYPGTESRFDDCSRGPQTLAVNDILFADWAGVGALALNPLTYHQEEGGER